jgi:hypothetical protein
VADDLRDGDRRALLARSPDERVKLAFALGEADLEAFRLAHDPPLSRADAARLLERRRQAGRRPCRCRPVDGAPVVSTPALRPPMENAGD